MQAVITESRFDVTGTGGNQFQKQAFVPIISRETCNEQTYHNGTVSVNMLCAGYEEGGTDACQVTQVLINFLLWLIMVINVFMLALGKDHHTYFLCM